MKFLFYVLYFMWLLLLRGLSRRLCFYKQILHFNVPFLGYELRTFSSTINLTSLPCRGQLTVYKPEFFAEDNVDIWRKQERILFWNLLSDKDTFPRLFVNVKYKLLWNYKHKQPKNNFIPVVSHIFMCIHEWMSDWMRWSVRNNW
jgi:hypothetical protein